MIRCASSALFCALLLASVGCKPTAENVGGKRAPAIARRVISLSPGSTEIVGGALASVTSIVGRTQADNFPENIGHIDVVASVKPDYEKITKLAPDLIVYDSSLYNSNDIDKMKQLNVEMFDYSPTSYSDFEKQVRALSVKLAAETEASKFLDSCYAVIQDASSHPLSPQPSIAWILPGPGGKHMIAGTDSFLGDLSSKLGAKPVGPKGKLFVDLNAESLIQENPDYIISAVLKPDETEVFTKDPRFAGLKAVKEKHVFSVHQDYVVRRGARMDKFMSAVRKILTGGA